MYVREIPKLFGHVIFLRRWFVFQSPPSESTELRVTRCLQDIDLAEGRVEFNGYYLLKSIAISITIPW